MRNYGEFDLPPAAPVPEKKHDWPAIIGALLSLAVVGWLASLVMAPKWTPAAPVTEPAAAPVVAPVVTPAAAPEPQAAEWPPASLSPAPAPTHHFAWHKVKRFEGSSVKDTETFDIQGGEWRVSWNTWTAGEDTSNFAVWVRTAEGGNKALVGNIIGGGSDTSYLRGSGSYYLDISSGQPYTIEVEEWR